MAQFLSRPQHLADTPMRPAARLVATLATVLLSAATLAGCEEDPLPKAKALQPQAPVLPRLTRAQYDNHVRDVLGADLTLPPQLEPDVSYDDLLTVGAGIATTSQRGIELYEQAARNLAQQVVAKPERIAALQPCTMAAPDDAVCLGQWVDKLGTQLWRRPLTTADKEAIVGRAAKAGQTLGKAEASIEYAIASLLQSPYFLYRVELGEPIKAGSSALRLTGQELAARLSLFLWNGPPDAALTAAASSGALLTDAGLSTQVERMIADPKVRRGIRNFASEWLQLADLAKIAKDPNIFKHYSPDVLTSAKEETLRFVESIVLDKDLPVTELLRSKQTFVDRRLAAIYDIPAPSDADFGPTTLPKGERQGLLGQVTVLAMAAHPVSSSPTLRGIFVRKYLLCDEVLPPPAGVNTQLPEPSGNAVTLRERLTEHMAAPFCAGCHKTIDPIGFGLERFDGMGRYRTTDGGKQVDATGELDGVQFAGLNSLAEAIADSDKFRKCMVKKLYSYALARPVAAGESGELERLDSAFRTEGTKFKGLMRAVALSDGFVRLAAPVLTAPASTQGANP